MARREADPLAGRYWKVVNDNVTNDLGQPVAYKLRARARDQALRPPGLRGRQARAGSSSSPLWVTAYDRDELFATGDYPNQAAGGDGLPAFAARERNLTDTDVVLWFTFGTNHVVRPEDWPVMPVHPIGFKLLPCRLLRRQPGARQPPARRRPLPRHLERPDPPMCADRKTRSYQTHTYAKTGKYHK